MPDERPPRDFPKPGANPEGEFSREAILGEIRRAVDERIKKVSGLADIVAALPSGTVGTDRERAIVDRVPKDFSVDMFDLVLIDTTTMDGDFTDDDLRMWDTVINEKGKITLPDFQAYVHDRKITENNNRRVLFAALGNKVMVRSYDESE